VDGHKDSIENSKNENNDQIIDNKNDNLSFKDNITNINKNDQIIDNKLKYNDQIRDKKKENKNNLTNINKNDQIIDNKLKYNVQIRDNKKENKNNL